MTVGTLACSAAPRQSAPERAPYRAAVLASTAAPLPPSSTATSAAQVDEWFREVVDPEVQPRPISLSVLAGLITVAVNPYRADERATAFVSDGKQWDERVLNEHEPMVASTWEPNGVPTLLLDAKRGVAVKRGLDGLPEVLTFGRTAFFAHDIATDPDGVPHVCFSLDKEENAKEFIYAARTNLKKTGASAWHQERIPMAIGDCRIVATEHGVHIIVESDRGVSALSKIDSGPWKIEKLSSDWFASVAAARSPAGHVTLAFSDNQTVHLVRYANGQTQRSKIALGLKSGDVRGLAMAVDRNNVVHVAFSLSHGSVDGEVMYATERAPAAVLVSLDRPERIALAVGEENRPHLAYVVRWPEERKNHLMHVRMRTLAERTQPSGTYIKDEALQLKSCATLIAGEIGEVHGTIEHQRAVRWCDFRANPSFPTKEHLIARCKSGDVDACLVEGTLAGQLKVRSNLELAHDVCESGNKRERCFATFEVKAPLAGWFRKRNDDAEALKLFEKACALGSKAACVLFATSEQGPQQSSVDLLASACSQEIPIACAAFLIATEDNAEPAKGVLSRVRGSLTKACSGGEKPEGCNALAYMEEGGLGGAVRLADAVRHHLRACELGSVLSCVRLLTGPFGRPRPPKTLDQERFEELLSTPCSARHQGACIALATAYDTGWVVGRDREKAQAILDEACEAGHAGACKRAKNRNR